jgi:hypothetical protein
VNYLENILYQGMWVRAPELITSPDNPTPTDGPDIVPNYAAELALVGNAQALFRRLNLLLCAGQLSDTTLNEMITLFTTYEGSNASSPDNVKRSYVAKAIMFVMCSAEYLVQK